MPREIPLGELESQRLEFKSAQALDRPETIVREVVAMLNADGGHVWVGLGEKEGRAAWVEGVPDAERARRSLVDSLTDTISPSPTGREVSVETVHDPTGATVLVIAVQPTQTRKPYALVRSGGWQFPLRVDSRIRSLAREEIFGSGERDEIGGTRRTAASDVLDRRLDEERGRGGESFLMLAEPLEPGTIDLGALRDSGYLTDPVGLGDRRFGHSVANAAWLGNEALVPGRDGVGIGREGIFHLDVFRNGGVRFRAPLVSFFRPGPPGVALEKTLFPLALLEYPTSVCRLLARLYSDPALWEEGPPGTSSKVLATLAIFDLGEWTLRPRSPRDWSSFDLPPARRFPGSDFLLPEPIAWTVQDVVDSPDDSARRLWSRIYEAFGFWPEDYPPEFDRSSGLLIA